MFDRRALYSDVRSFGFDVMKEQESYIAAVKNFNKFLERKKMRKTPERFAILKAAWRMSHHFNADELHDRLEEESYHVSRATVFNTIDILVESGVLRRHQFGNGKNVYEPSRGNHLHLICTHCGKVRELMDKDNTLGAMINTRCNSSSFEPAYTNAYIYGVCGQCARKIKRMEKRNSDN